MREHEGIHQDSRQKLESAYRSEHPRLVARLRRAGRTLEEAEDLIHDAYAHAMSRLSLIAGIRNIPAWIRTLVRNRSIDIWRREQLREASGETSVAEETLREVIAEAGLDPLEGFVRENLTDALYDAIAALPAAQRWVIEMQVFRETGFRELAEISGESIDTLMARKRYAIAHLSRALRHWIES